MTVPLWLVLVVFLVVLIYVVFRIRRERRIADLVYRGALKSFNEKQRAMHRSTR